MTGQVRHANKQGDPACACAIVAIRSQAVSFSACRGECVKTGAKSSFPPATGRFSIRRQRERDKIFSFYWAAVMVRNPRFRVYTWPPRWFENPFSNPIDPPGGRDRAGLRRMGRGYCPENREKYTPQNLESRLWAVLQWSAVGHWANDDAPKEERGGARRVLRGSCARGARSNLSEPSAPAPGSCGACRV